MNNNIICFKNGTYYLDKMIFDAKIDNLFSCNTGYDYIKIYNNMLWLTLQQCFVNSDEYQLFMKYMYKLFIGTPIKIKLLL